MSLTIKPESAEQADYPPTEKTVTDCTHAAPPLRVSVEQALLRYFTHLDGHSACGLYDLVLAEVETPLLELTLTYVQGNQSKAAQMLGLNRGTLRKKLKQYDLL